MSKYPKKYTLYLKKYTFMFGVLFFASGLAYFYMSLLPYKTDTDIPLYALLGGYDRLIQLIVAVGVVGYFALNALPVRPKGAKPSWLMVAFWCAALILSVPFAVTNDLLGTNEMEPILIFFKDNRVSDLQAIGIDGFKWQLFKWAALMVILFFGSYLLLRSKKYAAQVLVCLGMILLLSSPLAQYILRLTIPNHAHQNFVVVDRLHEPIILEKPNQQKNLIIVYLESIERSYGDIAELDKFYKPLDDLAARGREFTNVHEVTGTNYTIAGMVAGQCGVPLLPNALQFHSVKEAETSTFMPNVRCLGDVLSNDGYTLSYMNGASADKFSKRSFYTEHGYTRIFDKNSLSDAQKQGRSNVWGINDALLFEHAYKEYDTLKATGDPFALSLLSLSTHGPNAYLDNDCAPTPGAASQIPRAIQCTSQLVTKLVDYIAAQGDADNTVVVVQGDHLALFNSLRSQLASVAPNRRNLFMMLGTAVPSKTDRAMSPFDYYPTILEGMGYSLKDGRANFGVSANSDSANLMEELGKTTINKTFKANHNVTSFLWRENDNTPETNDTVMELVSN